MNHHQIRMDQQQDGKEELARQVTAACAATPARVTARRVLVGEKRTYSADPAELAELHAAILQGQGPRILYTSVTPKSGK